MAWFLAYFLKYHPPLINTDFTDTIFYSQHMTFVFPLLLIFSIVFHSVKLYAPRRESAMYVEQFDVIKSNTLALLVLITINFFFDEINFSKGFLLSFWLFINILMIFSRLLIRFSLRILRQKGYNLRHVIIIGTGDCGRNLAAEILQNHWTGLNILGFVDNRYSIGQKIDGIPVIGSFRDIKKIVESKNVDQIFITLPIKYYRSIEKIVNEISDQMVTIRVVPDLFQSSKFKKFTVETLANLPLMTVTDLPLNSGLNLLSKRILDVMFSVIAVILTAPIMLLVALLIKLTSRGPVFYMQERIGLNGRKFMMYKFRTMKVHYTKEEDEIKAANHVTELFTKKDDPRKTAFGNFLRKTSLDELPQFLNVLAGDMSVVGPRPERPLIVEQLKNEIPQYDQRHKTKAGITGWAQVNGWRGNTSLYKRVECDIYYIKNWSFLFDLKIMILTIINGFINKNAY